MEVPITPAGVSLEGVEVMDLLEVVTVHPEEVTDPQEVVMDHLEAVMDHLEETADVISHISVQTSLLEKGMNLNFPLQNYFLLFTHKPISVVAFSYLLSFLFYIVILNIDE